MVDRIAQPAGLLAAGLGDGDRRFECPMFARIFAALRRCGGFRPFGPLIDPCSEQPICSDVSGSFFFGIRAMSSRIPATAWMIRLSALLPETSSGPVSPPLRAACFFIQTQAGFLLIGPMTFVTGSAENRLNILYEGDLSFGRRRKTFPAAKAVADASEKLMAEIAR